MKRVKIEEKLLDGQQEVTNALLNGTIRDPYDFSPRLGFTTQPKL